MRLQIADAEAHSVERELLPRPSMDLIPLKLAAAQLGLSAGYVRALCRNRRVPGAVFDRRRWYVPDGAQVIRRASGLFHAAGQSGSVEARRTAEVEARMRRLAAALAAVDGPPPVEGADGAVESGGAPPNEDGAGSR